MTDENTNKRSRREATALLSQRERKYLRDGAHIEPNSANERAIRSSIRRKLVHLFNDLEIITNNIEDRDVIQVQNKIREDADTAYDSLNRFAEQFLEDAITAQRTSRVVIDTPNDEFAKLLKETAQETEQSEQ